MSRTQHHELHIQDSSHAILIQQAEVCARNADEAAKQGRYLSASGLYRTAAELARRASAPAEAPADGVDGNKSADGVDGDSAPLSFRLRDWEDAAKRYANCATIEDSALPSDEVATSFLLRLPPCPDALERPEALKTALEVVTASSWRWAGSTRSNLLVERNAPYRAVVLRGETLQIWREWCNSTNAPTPCELHVEAHAPLRWA